MRRYSFRLFMYQEFFSLKIKPFSISPDPNFLFLSERHKEAIIHLQHGLQGHTGFALLTGEVGTGKTTICRALIENMDENSDIASILNPALSDVELLSTICDNFKIKYHNNELSNLFERLTAWIINNSEQGRRSIVIVDEAQHLNFSALEQLRLLTDIETNNKKVLQVILIGQTELQEKLKQTEFLQLAQRITARYHLLSLNAQESHLYIQHRLNIAGSNHAIFDKSALQEIFKKCAGTPRLTNILCDKSLLVAYTQDSHIVTLKMVKQASTEIHFTIQESDKGVLGTHWRLTTLILLTFFTLWQAPKILTRLNPEELQLTVNEKSLLSNITPQAHWFDSYPQLDLTHTNYQDTLATLYSVWGYQVESKHENCKKMNSAHITCYSNNMNLQQLKQLNYPSVVGLENDRGKTLYVVIYRIADDYQLLIDDQLISVTEQWFKNYWSGETTLLWQSPFELRNVIKLGQQGAHVTWLANQLNQQQGKASEHKTTFDLPLLAQVIAFQRQQGLTDDGIVGPLTLMHLMHLITPNSPQLIHLDHSRKRVHVDDFTSSTKK